MLFSQQEVSADIIQIQLLETSPHKKKEQRQQQVGADKLVTTQIWKLKGTWQRGGFSGVFAEIGLA